MFYIGTRHNPQLKGAYYMALGRLSKKDAAKRERPVYGSVTLTGYLTEVDYNAAIQRLKDAGNRVL